MSKEMGAYDTSLQMFVEKPHEIDFVKAGFTKHLVETGKLTGDTAAEVIQLADVRAELAAIKPATPQEAVAANGDY